MKEYTPSVELRHRIPVQVRFNDTDMFGHLNNSVYLQFMDLGKYAYYHNFMDGGLVDGPTAPVIVNINCSFYTPAYMDEKLFVRTATVHIGESSMTLEQCVENDRGQVKSSAITTLVNIDLKTGAPTPIDGEWRRKISEYEGRIL